MTDFSDEALMLRVCQDELDALGLLFERHHRALYSYFVRLTGNRARSHDLVQTVFERILKYRSSYRAGTAFTAWFYRIGRNVGYDDLNAQQRGPELVSTEALAQHPVTEDYPDASLGHDQLYQALQALSDADREVLLLSRIEGLSYPEVAHVLETSVNAVRIRVCRALKALKTAYMALEPSP